MSKFDLQKSLNEITNNFDKEVSSYYSDDRSEPATKSELNHLARMTSRALDSLKEAILRNFD